MASKNILVAFGGVSPEHEVSVITALQAASALEETPYSPIPLYVTKSGKWLTGSPLLDLENYQDLKKLETLGSACTFTHTSDGRAVLMETEAKGLFKKPAQHNIYAVLTAFHGSEGENGAFQGLCEMFNLPYTGSGILGSSVGMDKSVAKDVCSSHNLPVVPSVTFYENEWEENQEEILKKINNLSYPVFVKPDRLGSSIGVMQSKDEKSIIDTIETAFRYDAKLIVEKAITPLMEINCSVLGNSKKAEASVCEQPKGNAALLTFEDKYLSGDGKGMASADRIIPAPISDELTERIRKLSIQIFRELEAAGVARLDFLINSKTEEIYFNEINTIPGSFSFYLWNKSGYEFPQLLEKLIDIAVEAHREKNGRVRSYETNLLNKKSVEGIKGLKFKK